MKRPKWCIITLSLSAYAADTPQTPFQETKTPLDQNLSNTPNKLTEEELDALARKVLNDLRSGVILTDFLEDTGNFYRNDNESYNTAAINLLRRIIHEYQYGN
jgi:hypothetical protein